MCDYLLPHREVWLFNLLLKIHNNVSKCWDDLFLFLVKKKRKLEETSSVVMNL